MKKSVFVLLPVIMLFMMAMKTSVQAQWVVHTDAEKFSISFPAAPMRATPAVAAPMVMKVELTQQTPGFARFLCLYERMSAPYAPSIDSLLSDKIARHAGHIKGNVKTTGVMTPWKGGNYKQGTIETGTGLYCNAFVFIIGNESFLLTAENNGAYVAATEWNKFWTSLKP